MSTSDSWVEAYVPIDPLLKEPLDLHGERAKRRHQVDALARQLGFGHRVDEWDARGLEPSTYRLLFEMLDRLADARSQYRIHVSVQAGRIVAGYDFPTHYRIDGPAAGQALIDLGLGHLGVELEDSRPEIRQVFDALGEVYLSAMKARVLQMLRQWESRAWVSDKAA